MKTIVEYKLKKIPTDIPKEKLNWSGAIERYVRKFYSDDIGIYESFFILLLNRNMETIGYAKISQGGIVGTVVDLKIIYQYVVQSMASAVIICHNHPSGNLNPSKHDIKITKAISIGLKQVCNSILVDHIILTEEGYFSFKENEIKF